MNATFDWHCPHCGKRVTGDPATYVIEMSRWMHPLTYRLCEDCAAKHHAWMEGDE